MIASSTQHSVRAEGPPRRGAAVAAALGFIALAAFQLALALGAPLGSAAWGGTYDQLPAGLRIASAFAVGVWVLAALTVLRRVGFRISPLRPAIARRERGSWSACFFSVRS